MALALPKSSQSLRSQKEKPLAKSALSTKRIIDIKSLSRGLPINPFMSTKFHQTHNDSIVVPDFMFERIKFMEDIGET